MGTHYHDIDPHTGNISSGGFKGTPLEREVYIVRLGVDSVYGTKSDADAAVVAARISAGIQRDVIREEERTHDE